MINKKRVVLSVLCLMLFVFSVFSLSACKNEVENFNLSFKVNGETYHTITTSGDEAIAIPENPTKEGYTFDGWYWDKDVWSKPFTANSLMDAPISSDMSVYAKFSAIKYNITYENDGGTHSNPTSYTIEDSFALSAAEKNGYTFVGWYSDSAYTTKVESVSVGSTGAITLYAKFEINNYTISYGNTKDAANNNVTSYNVNTDTITLSDLSKTGYVFEGWYNGDEKVTEIVKGSTGDITLTAKWSVIGYEITYHNVDGATNSNSATYDVEDQPLALDDASKDGYRFLGWYTDAAFTNRVSEIAIGTTGDINLYAKWELVEYTVTFKDGDTVVGEVKFTVETESITEPAVPNHTGYNGTWESYTLGTENITVNAVYSLIGYNITYNNVSVATNNNPATYDVEDQPLALIDASRDHYTFLGWYSDAAFTNKVTEISVGTTGDITLYAKWEAIEYTATFMDGTTVVGTVKFTVETESITEPAVPNHTGYNGTWESYTLGTENITVNAVYSLIGYNITYNNVSVATNNNPATYDVEDQPLALVNASKDHYTFLGWYSDAAFTNKVTEISVGTTGDITLYAKWEAIEYTATFMDGTTVVGTVKFTVETESITEPAVPEHVGYNGAWESYTLGTEDITVNAVYSLISYNITYNNVSGATNSNPATYNVEDQPLVLIDAIKDHYTFLGWYSDASFTTKVTEIAVGTTGTVELYAKWKAVEYTITFLYDNAIGDYAEGTVVKTTYTVEDEFEFAALVCKTVGYTFDGWFTEKNVGTGTKVTGVTKGTSGSITVYAQFGLEEYDITYNNVNGATNNNPTHYNAASEDFTIYPLTKEGYTFDDWFTNEECTTPANLTITKGSNGDITLYAKWTPITYTIEYVTYGGTATGNPATYIVTDSITFNNATLSGYVFKGWYTASEGGSKVTGITAGTTGNIILYAHWDYVSTITFESNGGSPVNSISNVEGTTISAPTAPTKEHYTFAGWYSDAALKNAYSFTTQPAEDIILYAKWTPVVYEIEYVLNGGTNSENNVVEYTVEDKIELYAPSKVGYTFVGWFTDAEFTSSVVTELKVGTSGKITLYAHYSINQYTISFESNGGTSVSAITQNYATSVTAPEAPSKNGYTFAGWYSNASLTSKYTFSTMPAEDIILYAKWDLANYNIVYNLNGGTNNSSNPATYTITSATITLKAPTKTGYSFAGWYTDAECTEAITEITSGSYGVVELFAKWTATEYTITYVTADGATHSNILTYTIETDLTTLADATLKGHAFGGWYTDDSYQTAVTTVAGGEIGHKTVYAKFTANTYNIWLDGNEEASCVVSFNLNGAEGTIASQTVTPTATLKYPTVPTRDGYIFAGWYDNENCTSSLYDFTAVVTSDTTLYAKWVKVENATAIAINGSSNVTLNGKYEQMLMFVPLVSGNITITASGSYDTFGVLYSSDMTALVQNDDGASDGSNFLIVYNVTAGETYYIGARAFSSTTTGTATVSVAGSTTVLDGGYAVTASKGSATYGQNFTLNVPNSRDGYKFLGYADENGVMYTDATGASVKVWDKDSDTTLYSQWERAVYTVTFVTSGGTPIDSIELAYGERLDIGKYVTTRSGYSFNGWYLDGTEYNATTMPDHDITLTAYWKTFALGTIKYDVDKIVVSVDDEITADLFSAICLDTDGNLATFTVTVSGTQAAGETISVRLVAKSGNKTKQITINDIKVYGDPTLAFNNDVEYFNIKDGLNAAWFSASGTDSFGNPTTILVYVDYDYEEGDFVTITIESRDTAGNSTYGYIDDVKAYGLPKITYNGNKNVISVNDTLNAELLNATAKDSFGEDVAVTVSLYSGTISAGNTVTLRISATDSKGNVKNIDIQCKVYSTPTISEASKTDIREEDNITAELLGITGTDTYGEDLTVTLSIKDGSKTAGTVLTITATVTDAAGNIATRDYELKVYGKPTITYEQDAVKVTEDATAPANVSVTFNLNGGSGNVASQIVSATEGITYPSTIPTRNGYAFTGWYTSADCTELYDFTKSIVSDITLYAGWEAMVTSGYYSRTYIDIYSNYNSSSNPLSFSTSNTSSSSYRYTYFTALDDGQYTLYYRNSSSSSSYGTYIYVYNATQGTVIKSNTKINSTSFTSSGSYVTFSANAGDVIYVRNYKYSSNATFYMYVTGASKPVDGGLSEKAGANSILNALAKDSFGNELKVIASVKDGDLISGSTIVYNLTATDHLGNTLTIPTEAIGVYDVNDIKLTYLAGMSDLIKLSSKGEEFDAKATDSFGNACDITIEAAQGYTFAGGQVITLYIVATDKAGNRVVSDAIEEIKVYDVPTVIFNIYENSDINFAVVVKDSFGEELYAEISLDGELAAGNIVYVTVKAEDDAHNIIDKTYECIVQREGHTYTEKEDGTYELTSYVGTNATVEILSSYAGKAVTSIADNAFKNQTTVKTIIIPETIVSIGNYAFYGCTELSNITIPSNVEAIGYSTFYNCAKLVNVNIPNKVTSIGSSAFYGCSSLTSLVVPDSVTSIGSQAFRNCTSLKSLTIGKGVSTLSSGLLYGCSSLEELTIPFVGYSKSSTSASSSTLFGYIFGTSSFDGAVATTQNYSTSSSSTATYYIPATLKSVTVTGGNVLYGAFYNCSNLTNIVIGNDVTTVGSFALWGCSALEQLTIPFVGSTANATTASETSLFGYIFGSSSYTSSASTKQYYASGSYKTYYIPTNLKNVTVLGGSVLYGGFYNCVNIESITLGDNVSSIGERAFYYCSSLTSVRILNSISSIGTYAFYNCSKLADVYIEDMADWLGITFGANYSSPLYYADNLYINDKLVTELVIPDGIETIGAGVFNGYTNLTSVTIPESVKSIGNNAFSNCINLVEIRFNATNMNDLTSSNYVFTKAGQNGEGVTVIIGKNVTKIPAYLFYPDYGSSFAPKITTIKFEDNSKFESIGSNAFCSDALSAVYITDIASWCNMTISYDSNPLRYAGNLYLNGELVTNLVIPDSVTSINSYVFYNCTSLTSVTIGKNLGNISSDAFIGCTNLTGVYISDIESWCNITFGDYEANPLYFAKNLYLNGVLVTSLVIPDSVTKISSYAFYNCENLTTLTIGKNVESIGYQAFRDCTMITKIYFNATAMNDLSSHNYIFYNAGVNSNGIEVIIGANVTKIPSYIFYPYQSNEHVPNIINVKFEDGSVCETIGEAAFQGCGSITSIEIPNSVTSIGSYAFSYCTAMTSVVIGKNVESIESSAFSNCHKLVVVYNNSSLTITAGSTDNGYVGYYALSIYTPETGGGNVWTDDDGYTFYESDEGCYLMGYTGTATQLTLPETCNGKNYGIYNYAFYKCTGIVSVAIPNSVTNIGNYAFYGCSSLDTITIGNGVTGIGNYAFYGCSSLDTITIGNGVTGIGEYAFSGCENMTKVTLPTNNNVSSIGKYAFQNCSKLVTITVPAKITVLNEGVFYNCSSLKDIILPEGVTTISDKAFYNCSSLTTIHIPSTVTSIGSYDGKALAIGNAQAGEYDEGSHAFTGCSSVVSITVASGNTKYKSTNNCLIEISSKKLVLGCKNSIIPTDGSVKTIGQYAFHRCTGLQSITIPNTVTIIENGAFYGCTSLYSINIPSSVTSIGIMAFSGCSSLSIMTVDSANTVYHSSGNCIIITSSASLAFGCKNSVIPSDGSVDDISSYAFYDCDDLSITIPESVTYIGQRAFYRCDRENVRCEGTDSWTGSYVYGWNGYPMYTSRTGSLGSLDVTSNYKYLYR